MTNSKATDNKEKDDTEWNPNSRCYELLAPFYADIYGEIDADETVRQWWQLLTTETNLFTAQPQTLRLLDVGCGPGWQMLAWQEMGFNVAGIDSSPTMLALARALFESKNRAIELYLADITDLCSNPVLSTFDLVVSHFNFINLFTPRQREKLFRSVASFVRPGGFWIADFSEPCHAPKDEIDTLTLPSGEALIRKGQYNMMLNCYQQDWQTPFHHIQECFWFDHRKLVPLLAADTGWNLCLRKAWHPNKLEEIWTDPNEKDEVFVDIYQLKG